MIIGKIVYRTDLVISTRDGGIVETPIVEALEMQKHLQMDRYEVLEAVGISMPHFGLKDD